MQIQNKIREYLETHTLEQAQKSLNIGFGTILSLRDETGKKYSNIVLDKVYKFFNLKKDAEYFSLCKERRTNADIIGNILYYRRISLGLTIWRVSADTRVSEKQIERLERGKTSFFRDSTIITPLIDYYNFSEEEKKAIYEHIKTLKKLSRIERLYK